jgi:hypothetical protein
VARTHTTNFRRKFTCIHRPPITPITPIAASSTPSHPQSVSLCRGANSLRPHPDGPHTLLLGYHHFLRPHTLWPEAIAARWSCGPHVTPASNRRRRCRAGVDDATHSQGTSEMCRLCYDHVTTPSAARTRMAHTPNIAAVKTIISLGERTL